jgi:hypothetical protein
MHHHLLIGALDSGFLYSEVAKIRGEVHGRVFRSYLKPNFYLLNILVPLDLYAVHYVSIVLPSERRGRGRPICYLAKPPNMTINLDNTPANWSQAVLWEGKQDD